MEKPPRGHALFDLDHTLLPFDTQGLFCNFVLRREGWRRFYLLLFLPCVPLAVLKLLSLKTMKRIFCSYLWKMPEDRLRGYARDFADAVVKAYAYPEIVEELERQKSEGRITILNSASPAFYVEEFARAFGFDHWVATRLQVEDPMPLIPKIEGPNNKLWAKIDAMRPLLPEGFDGRNGDVLPDSWGYSDSVTDVPLLVVCENGVMIHPSEVFAQVGNSKGWETRQPNRPYGGKWAGRFASLRQALGLYSLPGSGNSL